MALRWSRLRGLAGQDYRRSVFRRSGVLLALLVPAYAANLAVMYFAAKLLSAEQFGLFYVANTLSNILFSGSLILNTFFTRHLVAVVEQAGAPAAFGRMRRVEKVVVLWGALAAAAAFLAMAGASRKLGVQSYLIVLFIVCDVYTAYVSELGRIMLQALHRTFLLGSYTLVWMMLRFVLCIAGILAFGTVWGALSGVVAAALIVYCGFHIWVARNAGPVPERVPAMPSPTTLVPSVLGNGLSIVMANLDILLAYLLLSQTQLGIYSASSIFPKAMLVVMTPLLQMLFPTLVGTEHTRAQLLFFLGKTSMALLLLAGAGAAVVWLLSPYVCGGSWGMPLCDPPLLGVMLLSVVPLVLLRLLVLLGFARGRDWLPAWLAPPTLVYLWFVFASTPSSTVLARQFVAFAAVAFMFFFVVNLVATRSRVFQPG